MHPKAVKMTLTRERASKNVGKLKNNKVSSTRTPYAVSLPMPRVVKAIRTVATAPIAQPANQIVRIKPYEICRAILLPPDGTLYQAPNALPPAGIDRPSLLIGTGGWQTRFSDEGVDMYAC